MDVFERAARIYCTNSGQDPDTVVGQVRHPMAPNVTQDVYLWQTVVERVKDLHTLLSAMKEAAAMPVPANDAARGH